MNCKIGKVIMIIMIVFTLLISFTGVSNAASTLDVKLSTTTTEIEKGKEVSVLVSLNNINVGEGVNTLKGTVNYNADVLEYVNSEAQNGWSITYNSTNGTLLVVYMSGLVTKDQGIAKLTFKVKDNADVTNTQISLTNIESSNADEKVTPKDASLNLTIIDENKQDPTNPDDPNQGGNQNPSDSEQGDNQNQGGNQNQGSSNQGNNQNSNSGQQNLSGTNKNQTSTSGQNNSSGLANKAIPYTGTSGIIIGVILVIIAIGIISYIKYRKYKGV